jgi:thioesterase domain-containing protein
MAAGMPIYGLQATWLNSADSSQTSVEAIAAQYVEEIRHIQPHGPYRLAGYSVGGLIAYEMANQLIGDDESVEFVGMIDTHKRVALTETDDLDVDVSILLDYVGKRVGKIEDSELSKLIAVPELSFVLDKCKQAGYLPTEVTLEEVQERIKVVRIIDKAATNYFPQRIQIPIHLFAADTLPGEDITRGWGSLVGEGLNFKLIGGTHYSIMEQPYLQRLTDAISQALQETECKAHARCRCKRNVFCSYGASYWRTSSNIWTTTTWP